MTQKIDPVSGVAHNGQISIAYEVFGPGTGKPLLLMMGIGMQMLMWNDDFCRELVEHGFQVVRIDNRDVGLSTHLDTLGEPNMFYMYVYPKKAAFYSLHDMAADGIAVLDDLGWQTANIVGGSMGGMIAQTMAIDYPKRVRTLTSIMSSPSAQIGRSKISLAIKIGGLLQQPVHTTDEAGQQVVDMYKIIGTPPENYPLDETWLREVGVEGYRRGYDPAGKLRQQAAMLAAPNRTKDLRKLHIPTLVMHGSADPMITLEGGQATAKAIPGAKLVILPGVGHGGFPRAVWPTMIENISQIAKY